MIQAPTPTSRPPVARPLADVPPPPPPVSGNPLQPEQLHELELARQRFRKIRRAIGVARFNGWSVAVFAVPSLLCGLFSLTSLLIGAALAVVAYNEFAGAKLLRELDERAPRRLGFNQLGFCAVLITYALWSIHSALSGPSSLDEAIGSSAQAAAMLGSVEQLQRTITLAVYGGLIGGSLIFQGGTAWYYFTRLDHLRTYVSETPRWIIDLERAAGGA